MQASRRLVLRSSLGLVTVGCGLTLAASCWVDIELLQLRSNTLAPPGPCGPPPALNFMLRFSWKLAHLCCQCLLKAGSSRNLRSLEAKMMNLNGNFVMEDHLFLPASLCHRGVCLFGLGWMDLHQSTIQKERLNPAVTSFRCGFNVEAN